MYECKHSHIHSHAYMYTLTHTHITPRCATDGILRTNKRSRQIQAVDVVGASPSTMENSISSAHAHIRTCAYIHTSAHTHTQRQKVEFVHVVVTFEQISVSHPDWHIKLRRNFVPPVCGARTGACLWIRMYLLRITNRKYAWRLCVMYGIDLYTEVFSVIF